MYQYIYNSRCYQRCISIFIIVGEMYQRCMFIIVGATRDVSVYIIVGATRDVSVYL